MDYQTRDMTECRIIISYATQPITFIIIQWIWYNAMNVNVDRFYIVYSISYNMCYVIIYLLFREET